MEKQTLVILPGWSGSHETWQEFIDLSNKKYNTVCIDLPCFGDEPCPKEIWGVEDYAKFVQEKLSKLDKPVLLGHSFGGAIAAVMAASHPELIEKLILSGPAILRPKNRVRRGLFWTIAKIGKIIFTLPLLEKYSLTLKKILYRAGDSPDYNNTSEIKREIFKKIIREDRRDILPNIKTKTLIIQGTKDGYVPLRAGKYVAKHIPKGSLYTIKKGKHGLHLQQPKKLLSVVDSFIQKNT